MAVTNVLIAGVGGQGVILSSEILALAALATATAADPAAAQSPGASFDEMGIHTVQRGETLWSIALRYDLTVEDLVRLNATQPTSILWGE